MILPGKNSMLLLSFYIFQSSRALKRDFKGTIPCAYSPAEDLADSQMVSWRLCDRQRQSGGQAWTSSFQVFAADDFTSFPGAFFDCLKRYSRHSKVNSPEVPSNYACIILKWISLHGFWQSSGWALYSIRLPSSSKSVLRAGCWYMTKELAWDSSQAYRYLTNT